MPKAWVDHTDDYWDDPQLTSGQATVTRQLDDAEVKPKRAKHRRVGFLVPSRKIMGGKKRS